MKKLLSLVGVAVLSFSLFTGCGVDTKANEKAGVELTNAVQTVSQNVANLDQASAAEFQALAQEIDTFAKDTVKNAANLDSQEKVDEVTKKYEEFTKKVKDIADANGITIEAATEAAK